MGTPEELTRIIDYLKREFDMKNLGKMKFCLNLQIEHFSNGVLVHQLTYIEKVLKCFHMNKSHSLSSPMVIRLLKVNKDLFYPKEDHEDHENLFSPEVSYLSAISALMYLTNCIRLDTVFSMNLLVRYSFAPTQRHWNKIKHILHYLRGITYMSLFNAKWVKLEPFGYVDAGYFLDPHKNIGLKQDMCLLVVILQYHDDW